MSQVVKLALTIIRIVRDMIENVLLKIIYIEMCHSVEHK